MKQKLKMMAQRIIITKQMMCIMDIVVFMVTFIIINDTQIHSKYTEFTVHVKMIFSTYENCSMICKTRSLPLLVGHTPPWQGLMPACYEVSVKTNQV